MSGGSGKGEAPGVAAEHSGLVVLGEGEGTHRPDRVVETHVEWVVRAEEDVFGTGEAQKGPEQLLVVEHGVEVEPADRLLGIEVRPRASLRPLLPGPPDPGGEGGQDTAPVGEEDLQVGVTVEHAGEDELSGGGGRLDRVADGVPHVVLAEEVDREATAARMDEDEGVELLGRNPQRLERAVTEPPPACERRQLHAGETSLHDLAEEACGDLRHLQRHSPEAGEVLALGLHHRGHGPVLQPAQLCRLVIVEAGGKGAHPRREDGPAGAGGGELTKKDFWTGELAEDRVDGSPPEAHLGLPNALAVDGRPETVVAVSCELLRDEVDVGIDHRRAGRRGVPAIECCALAAGAHLTTRVIGGSL